MDHYLEPTMELGRAFMARGIAGSVVMLNLLRFRAVADYSRTPALAPAEPISGAAAFQRYIDHTLPFLKESGGKLLFQQRRRVPDRSCGRTLGHGDSVRQSSPELFVAFNSNAAYLAGLGHRLAALEDFRLLPLVEAVQDLS